MTSLLLWASFVPILALASQTGEDSVRAGIERQQQGDLQGAAAIYQEVLGRNSQFVKARHLLAICKLQLGQTEDPIRELEIVRKQDPANRDALYTLLSTYVAVSRLDEAQRLVERDLRADRSAEAYFMRGSYFMARAQYKEAVTQLETALRLKPRLPGLRSTLGVTLCFANRLDDAIPQLEAALRENAMDGNAAAFLGWVYKERDRGVEAAPLLERTVQTRPDDVGALFLLAQLRMARGNAQEAVEMLERVVGAQPEHRGAHVLLARLYDQLKWPEKAAREREIVARLNAALQAREPGAR